MSLRSIIGKHKEIGEYGCSKCNHYIPEYYSCTLKECIHGDKNTIDKNILDEIIARNSKQKNRKSHTAAKYRG